MHYINLESANRAKIFITIYLFTAPEFIKLRKLNTLKHERLIYLPELRPTVSKRRIVSVNELNILRPTKFKRLDEYRTRKPL